MSELRTKVCDSCGAIKKEVNHWWVVGLSTEKNYVVIFHSVNGCLLTNVESPKDACGTECALKLVAKEMSNL